MLFISWQRVKERMGRRGRKTIREGEAGTLVVWVRGTEPKASEGVGQVGGRKGAWGERWSGRRRSAGHARCLGRSPSA